MTGARGIRCALCLEEPATTELEWFPTGAAIPCCATCARRCGAAMVVEIPMPVPSAANLREHWAARAKRAASQRSTIAIVMRSRAVWSATPCTVKLTRIAPRELDSDNLLHALKPARDGVADWLGVKDNDPAVTWSYGQERGKPRYQAVRVEVTGNGADPCASHLWVDLDPFPQLARLRVCVTCGSTEVTPWAYVKQLGCTVVIPDPLRKPYETR